jgi:hypothetical protein
MSAYAFLQSRRLAQAEQKKRVIARRRSPACQQSGKPSLIAYPPRLHSNIHAVVVP